MRPVPFLVALVPVIAALVAVAAASGRMNWIEAGGLFYAWLALAEMAYLAVVFIRHGASERVRFGEPQDRRA